MKLRVSPAPSDGSARSACSSVTMIPGRGRRVAGLWGRIRQARVLDAGSWALACVTQEGPGTYIQKEGGLREACPSGKGHRFEADLGPTLALRPSEPHFSHLVSKAGWGEGGACGRTPVLERPRAWQENPSLLSVVATSP